MLRNKFLKVALFASLTFLLPAAAGAGTPDYCNVTNATDLITSLSSANYYGTCLDSASAKYIINIKGNIELTGTPIVINGDNIQLQGELTSTNGTVGAANKYSISSPDSALDYALIINGKGNSIRNLTIRGVIYNKGIGNTFVLNVIIAPVPLTSPNASLMYSDEAKKNDFGKSANTITLPDKRTFDGDMVKLICYNLIMKDSTTWCLTNTSIAPKLNSNCTNLDINANGADDYVDYWSTTLGASQKSLCISFQLWGYAQAAGKYNCLNVDVSGKTSNSNAKAGTYSDTTFTCTCPSGSSLDKNNFCVSCNASDHKAMTGGSCVCAPDYGFNSSNQCVKCDTVPGTLLKDGKCDPCPDGEEVVNGVCVAKCASDESRNTLGECEKCPSGQEMQAGACVNSVTTCGGDANANADCTCKDGFGHYYDPTRGMTATDMENFPCQQCGDNVSSIPNALYCECKIGYVRGMKGSCMSDKATLPANTELDSSKSVIICKDCYQPIWDTSKQSTVCTVIVGCTVPQPDCSLQPGTVLSVDKTSCVAGEQAAAGDCKCNFTVATEIPTARMLMPYLFIVSTGFGLAAFARAKRGKK